MLCMQPPFTRMNNQALSLSKEASRGAIPALAMGVFAWGIFVDQVHPNRLAPGVLRLGLARSAFVILGLR